MLAEISSDRRLARCTWCTLCRISSWSFISKLSTAYGSDKDAWLDSFFFLSRQLFLLLLLLKISMSAFVRLSSSMHLSMAHIGTVHLRYDDYCGASSNFPLSSVTGEGRAQRVGWCVAISSHQPSESIPWPAAQCVLKIVMPLLEIGRRGQGCQCRVFEDYCRLLLIVVGNKSNYVGNARQHLFNV